MRSSRRAVCRGTAALLAVPTLSVAGSATEHLQITDVQLPDTIEVGGTFTATITIENRVEREVTAEVIYRFEDNRVAGTDVSIAPGESRTVRLPNMQQEWLDAGPGVYTHGIGLADGGGESAEVRIVDQDATTAPPPDDAPPQGIELVERHLPEQLSNADPAFVGARIRNTRSSVATIPISYRFDGELVLTQDDVEIPPGEEGRIGFRDVTVTTIADSLGERPPAGTYRHSFGIIDGPRLEGRVRIPSGDGDTEAPPTESTPRDGESDFGEGGETESGRNDQAGSGEERSRGFISNSGDEPEFLSNPLNLTTLGFLLSVGGIVHQMVSGR